MFPTKNHLQILSIVLVGLLFIPPTSAEIFKCKTAIGQTIYSSIRCANKAEIFTPPNQSHNPSLKISEEIKSEPAVDIYITSWCPYCKKAMAYLHSKNITFNVFDIEKNKQSKVKKQKLAPGYTGIPLTVINGKVLKGFNENRFERALEL